MRINILKEPNDVNLSSFCFLAELIKVMSSDETHIVPD